MILLLLRLTLHAVCVTIWAPFSMKKPKRAKQWPPIYRAPQRSGQVSYQVDLGIVEGRRKRLTFPTKVEAETYAEQARVDRANEGVAAFKLPMDIRLDAAKANQILAPHNVTILEAAKHYEEHVLAYKTAPPVRKIVQEYINETISRNRRPDTIRDLRHRLNTFADYFGDFRLSEITLDELKEWLGRDEWEPRTRINFKTKISQLYGFALRHGWVDSNLTERIISPTVDEKPVEIYSVDEAQRLLTKAQEFDCVPYIAVGFFAGIRLTEMKRLTGRSINFDEKAIKVDAQAAKKRSQRFVDMQPALLDWLAPFRQALESGAPLVTDKFGKTKQFFLQAAGIERWPYNGLRHSFGSYHFAMFKDDGDTSKQMGNSVEMVHKHYKALVTKSEAEKFWALRPKN